MLTCKGFANKSLINALISVIHILEMEARTRKLVFALLNRTLTSIYITKIISFKELN
jgi:hypothetical protein